MEEGQAGKAPSPLSGSPHFLKVGPYTGRRCPHQTNPPMGRSPRILAPQLPGTLFSDNSPEGKAAYELGVFSVFTFIFLSRRLPKKSQNAPHLIPSSSPSSQRPDSLLRRPRLNPTLVLRRPPFSLQLTWAGLLRQPPKHCCDSPLKPCPWLC